MRRTENYWWFGSLIEYTRRYNKRGTFKVSEDVEDEGLVIEVETREETQICL